MNEWLLLLLAVISLPYVVVPFMIRRNHFFAERPQIRQVVGGFLPEGVTHYFQEKTLELNLLGFEHRIDVVSLDYGPDMRVFLRIYVALEKSMIALCTALVPTGSDKPLKSFVELSSRFSDGREVATHNSDLMGAPIEHTKKSSFYFPNETNLKVLFDCHERLLKRLGLHATKGTIPELGHEFSFLMASFKEDLIAQANLGCLEYDREENCYRPTWAGAFLMGWCSMWPISVVRLWMHKLKAKIRLRASKQFAVTEY